LEKREETAQQNRASDRGLADMSGYTVLVALDAALVIGFLCACLFSPVDD
jgi:hypothetical protein